MTTTTFDALAYFEKLKAAGVPEEQARVQANAFRDFSAIQDEKARNELATKKDVLQSEIRTGESIDNSRHEMLKWMVGLIITQSAMLIAIFAFMLAPNFMESGMAYRRKGFGKCPYKEARPDMGNNMGNIISVLTVIINDIGRISSQYCGPPCYQKNISLYPISPAMC